MAKELFLLVMVGSLVLAGIQKLASPLGFRTTLQLMGLPDGAAAVLTYGVPITEIAVGVVVLLVRSALSAVLLAILGAIFAIAGLATVWSGEKIQCRCFGPAFDEDSVLGWRQIAAFPFWVIAAYTGTTSAGWPMSARYSELALLVFVIFMMQYLRLAPKVAEAALHRRALAGSHRRVKSWSQ